MREPNANDEPLRVNIRCGLDCSDAHENNFNHGAAVSHQYILRNHRQLRFFNRRCDKDVVQFGRLLAIGILNDLSIRNLTLRCALQEDYVLKMDALLTYPQGIYSR